MQISRFVTLLVVLVMSFLALSGVASADSGIANAGPGPAVVVCRINCPELTIRTISIQPAGGGYMLFYEVKNTGNRDAGPFHIRVQADNFDYEVFRSNGLAAGQTYASATQVAVDRCFKITADSRNTVRESNEKNNVLNECVY